MFKMDIDRQMSDGMEEDQRNKIEKNMSLFSHSFDMDTVILNIILNHSSDSIDNSSASILFQNVISVFYKMKNIITFHFQAILDNANQNLIPRVQVFANILHLFVLLIRINPLLRDAIREQLCRLNLFNEEIEDTNQNQNQNRIQISRIFASLRKLRRYRCFGASNSIYDNSLSIDLSYLYKYIMISSNDDFSDNLQNEAIYFFMEVINLSPILQHVIIQPYFNHLSSSLSPSSLFLLNDTFMNENVSSTSNLVNVQNLSTLCDISQSTITIGNHIFESSRRSNIPYTASVILTKCTIENLDRLYDAFVTSRPILVFGEVGCGKSFLIREIAEILGLADTMIEIHIDEQTDSKSLMGSYVCSDVPGEFIWKNGILTQAALSGHWVIIENLELVPMDIFAAISSLLENRMFTLPDRDGLLEVHSMFRVFATSSSKSITPLLQDNCSSSSDCHNGTSDSDSHISNHDINAKESITSRISSISTYNKSVMYIPNLGHLSYIWYGVEIITPPLSEIKEILQQKYPLLLSQVIDILLSIYRLFVSNSNDFTFQDEELESSIMNMNMKKVRTFGCRDLFKLAKRIHRNVANTFNTVSGMITSEQRRLCLLDSIDVFAGSIRDQSTYQSMVMSLGRCWGLFDTDISSLILHSNPLIHGIGSMHLNIGRVSISIQQRDVIEEHRVQDYAFTSYSARILEKIAMCVSNRESVLLVGETGAGKTSSVQEVANLLGKKLLVQNLSLATDSSDLLGGFRPVYIKQLLRPIYEDFIVLFQDTFSSSNNTEFMQVVSQSYRTQQWKKLLKTFLKACDNALKKLSKSIHEIVSVTLHSYRISNPSKASIMYSKWKTFESKIIKLEVSLPRLEQGFAFTFVNGILVDAMRQGHWILLDEINLASSETLQGLSGILEGQSFTLTEKGDLEKIIRHQDFCIFAAMNPPTDVGKRELPAILRARFTELYVEEMLEKQDLRSVVKKYLSELSDNLCEDVVTTYLSCREYAQTKLIDSFGRRPHYSLRSLTRSLLVARNMMSSGFRSITRALFEGFVLNFYTKLDYGENRIFLWKYLLTSLGVKDSIKELTSPPSRPGGRSSVAEDWVLIKPFWLRAGSFQPIDWAEKNENGIFKFVITKSIEEYLRNITAGICAGVAPILLEGPTSVGKTTMIEYIAARTGNKCIRINNHEHTDVQEYIGGYCTDAQGRLIFRDGSLVEALRKGYWIILDELNLAPSDVLEALNRLLDDNHELFIPETGETIHPAIGFQLFATQNPSGIYGGRKPLSRAFRNRFIEIVVSDLQLDEVEEIICMSCGLPKKVGKMLVNTMAELQTRRQQTSIFQGKHGIVTLRDLIKWGKRQPESSLSVAIEGYMILAEKLRLSSEKESIVDILNKVCNVHLDTSSIYINRQDDENFQTLEQIQTGFRSGSTVAEGICGIAITSAMKRMWKLVSRGLQYNEPILLIGGTGTGKTTVCQVYAAYKNQPIRIVNCHQSIESSDIIGSLRPVRGREMILSSIRDHIANLYSSLCNYVNLFIDESIDLSTDIRSMIESLNVTNSLENTSEEKEIKQRIENIHKLKEYFLFILNGSENLQPVKKIKRTEQDIISRTSSISNNSTNTFHETITSLSSLVNQVVITIEELWQKYISLFDWQDGPLVEAMKYGYIFLLDEINLAEDAVIERLNSILESGRELTLAEKNSGEYTSEKIIAHPNFKFLATMNPGGDYGKRELSPALRSRFTEIWIPEFRLEDREDLLLIVLEVLKLSNLPIELSQVLSIQASQIMLQFLVDMNTLCKERSINNIKPSIRDLLAWANFISNHHPTNELQVYSAIFGGASMLLLDGLGVATSLSEDDVSIIRLELVEKLLQLLPISFRSYIQTNCQLLDSSVPYINNNRLILQDFSIPLGKYDLESNNYILTSTNTRENIFRILRATQLRRPILLEGAPGVGKTSIISTLASISGHKLIRINLSEQSDISDLFGTDLPTESSYNSDSSLHSVSGNAKFAWKDGIFLKAMKEGDWVLLDELNLAPQTVLEGLNSCFDHREEVFLPEIGQIVHMAPTFRIFCAQNPMIGGGGRKGLPQSLLSRFSRVYIESISLHDMTHITLEMSKKYQVNHYNIDFINYIETLIPLMVTFIHRLHQEVVVNGIFGRSGHPWEFNLRDVFRWLQLIYQLNDSYNINQNINNGTSIDMNHNSNKYIESIVSESVACIIQSRFRSFEDQDIVASLFQSILGFPLSVNSDPTFQFVNGTFHNSSSSLDMSIKYGLASISIDKYSCQLDYQSLSNLTNNNSNIIVGRGKKMIEYLFYCVNMSWPVLLIGEPGTGKHRYIRYLARIAGKQLIEYSASTSTDSSDLIGSYEQFNIYRHIVTMIQDLEKISVVITMKSIYCHQQYLSFNDIRSIYELLHLIDEIKKLANKVISENLILQSSGTLLISKINEINIMIKNLSILSIFSEIRNQCSQTMNQINQELLLISLKISSDEKGSFEWIHGIVVNAAIKGLWLLIDNVNLCSGSVLDRLNSLLEPNGTLLLVENGSGQIIKPHPDFRIFFTMVPSRGEVSRAMRNRCVEIYLLPELDSEIVFQHYIENFYYNPILSNHHQLNHSQRYYESIQEKNIQNLNRNSFYLLPKHKIFVSYHEQYQFLSSCSRNDSNNNSSNNNNDNDYSLVMVNSFLPYISDNIMKIITLLSLYSSKQTHQHQNQSMTLSWLFHVLKSTMLKHNTINKLKSHSNILLFLQERLQILLHHSNCLVFDESVLIEEVFQLIALNGKDISFKKYISEIISLVGLSSSLMDYEKFIIKYQTQIGPEGKNRAISNHLIKQVITHLVFDRYHVLKREELNKDFVQSLVLISSETIWPNGLVFGYAAYIGKLVPSTKDQMILLAIYRLMISLEETAIQISQVIVSKMMSLSSSVISETKMNSIDFFLVQKFQLIMKLRDMISSIMMEIVPSIKTLFIPWNELAVLFRWIKKLHVQIGRNLETDSILSNLLSDIFQNLSLSIIQFDKMIVEIWNHDLFCFEKCRLWKERGHAVLPRNKQDWELLQRILQFMRLWNNTSGRKDDYIYSSFVNGSQERNQDISMITELIFRRKRTKDGNNAIYDLLGLLSTFYWAYTNETSAFYPSVQQTNEDVIGMKTKNQGNRIESLLLTLTSDIQKVTSDFTFQNSSSSMDLIDILSQGRLLLLLQRDYEIMIQTHVIVSSEYMVVKMMFLLSDKLIFLIYCIENDDKLLITLLEELKSICKIILQQSIHSTLFRMESMREIQSLLWIIEATIEDKKSISALLSISKIFSITLNNHLYQFTSFNSFNHLYHDFQILFHRYTYQLPTYGLLLPIQKNYENSINDMLSSSQSCLLLLSGITCLLQPLLFQYACSHIDPKLLFPNHFIGDSMASITQSMCTSIAVSEEVCIIGNQLFYHERITSFIINQQGYSEQVFSRIKFMASLIRDMIFSCRDFLSPSVITILTSTRQYLSNPNETCNSFRLLYDCLNNFYQNHHSISNDYIRFIFTSLILPVIHSLSQIDFWQHSLQDMYRCGRNLAYTGLAYIQLVVPRLPVDPTSTYFVKSQFYKQEMMKLTTKSDIRVSVSALVGESIVNSQLEEVVERVDTIQNKITKYSKYIIERPVMDAVTDFHHLFSVLNEAMKNTIHFDHIHRLIEKPINIKNLSDMNMYIQQEVNYQGSILSLITQLSTEFNHYEDITSTIQCGLQLISQGIRMAVNEHVCEMNRILMNSTSSISISTKVLTTISSYPVMSDICFNQSSIRTQLEKKLLQFIDSLQVGMEELFRSGIRESIPLFSSHDKRKAYQRFVSHICSLTSIFMIEYVTGNHILLSKHPLVTSVDEKIITLFTNTFIVVTEEQLQKKLEEEKSFKHKTKVEEFASNDLLLEEEETDLRNQFPNHLKSFESLHIHDNIYPSLADKTVSQSIQSFESNDNSNYEDMKLFDDVTCFTIVSHYSKMNLLWGVQSFHEYLWKYKSTLSSSSSSASDETIHLSQNLMKHLFLSNRCLQPLFQFIISNTPTSLHTQGMTLAIFSSMTKHFNTIKNHSSSLSSPIKSSDLSMVDKDLIYLLKNNSYHSSNDFQTGSQVEETIKARSYLMVLLKRISEIMTVFPDNEMLLQLCRIISIILDFHLTTPLAKMLVSMELLLRKSQEWESFASKQYSLDEDMIKIKILIGHWRDMELQSWESLLRCKEEFYCRQATKSWFHLRNLIHQSIEIFHNLSSLHQLSNTTLSTTSWETLTKISPSWLFSKEIMSTIEIHGQNDVNQHIRKIYHVVDNYLRGSIVGEFPIKLHMIRSFACHILYCHLKNNNPYCLLEEDMEDEKRKNSTSNNNNTLRSFAYLLISLWQYYSHFLPIIRRFQQSYSKPIYQKLKEEVKMGKWDRMTSYGVLEYSEKIHRKLHKFIKSYQSDALNYSVDMLLRKEFLSDIYGPGGNVSESMAAITPCIEMPAQSTIFPFITAYDEEEKKENIKSKVESDIISNIREDILNKLQGFQSIVPLIIPTNHSNSDQLDSSESFDISTLIHRIPQLTNRLNKYLKSLLIVKQNNYHNIGVRYGQVASFITESFTEEIFDRIQSLRTDHSSKSMKQRAVVDLLSILKDHGISKSHHPASVYSRDHPILLSSTMGPLSAEVITTIDWSSDFNTNYNKAENYFHRNILELSQLRELAGLKARNRDLTDRDSSLLIRYAENLFLECLKLRSVLGAGVQDLKSFTSVITNLNSITTFTTTQIQYMKKTMEYIETVSSMLKSYVLEIQLLMETSKESNKTIDIHLKKDSDFIFVSDEEYRTIMTSLENILSFFKTSIISESHDSSHSLSLFGHIFSSSSSRRQILFCSFEEFQVSLEKFSVQLQFKVSNLLSMRQSMGKSISYEVTDTLLNQLHEVSSSLQSYSDDFITLQPRDINKSVMNFSDHDHSSKVYSTDKSITIHSMEYKMNECISHCLISVQKLNKISNQMKNHDNSINDTKPMFVGVFGEIIDTTLITETIPLQSLLSLTSLSLGSIQLRKITESINQLITQMIDNHTSSHLKLLQELFPLFEQIENASIILLEDTCASYKSLNKFLYVFIRVIRTLLTKGFCSPKQDNDNDDDDDDEGGDENGDENHMDRTRKFEDDVEGTGMGQGQGKRDVSNEIENEDQLLGLKDQPNDDQNNDNPPKDSKKSLSREEMEKGIEMSQDFDGETFDIDEEEGKGEEEEEGKGEEEEKSIDREMGEADDNDIVDIKQWNDEDENEEDEESNKNKETDDKFNKDLKMDGDVLPDEMTSNSRDEEDRDSKNKKGKDRDSKSKEFETNEGTNEESSDQDENDPFQEKEKNSDEKREDDTNTHWNNVPPPDNFETNSETSNQMEEVEEGNDGDGDADDSTKDNKNPEEETKMQENDLPDNMDFENNEDEETGLQDQDENDYNNLNNSNDEKINESTETNDVESMEEDHDSIKAENNNEKNHYPSAYGIQNQGKTSQVLSNFDQNQDDNDGVDTSSTSNQTDNKPHFNDNSIQNNKNYNEINNDSTYSHADKSGSNDNDDQSNQRKDQSVPNPFKEKGDFMKKWHRRLHMMLKDEEDYKDEDVEHDQGHHNDNEIENNDITKANQVYKEDDGQGDCKDLEQVLGQVSTSDIIQLPRDGEIEEHSKIQENEEMNQDTAYNDSNIQDNNPKKRKRTEKNQENQESVETSRGNQEENEEKSLSQAKEDETLVSTMDEQTINLNNFTNKLIINSQFNDSHNKTYKNNDKEEEEEEDDDDVHPTCKIMVNETPIDLSPSRQLWLHHRSITEIHSARLCEELRLLLEPTLAIRLQGDYRTGKRINMRKIISYIASGFRKDKIWLRRTKPAKRDYQVLIMIDNSKSMSQAGPLALSALSTIANALTRLEIGDLCIAQFAEDIQVIHSFGQTFDDEAGSKLFSQFHFLSNQTRLGHALSFVSQIFQTSTIRSHSNTMSSQLCFVVSDARIDSDDRSKLKRIVSDLTEKNILVVLLIVDVNENAKDSIFHTKMVEFQDSKIITSSYLDNFPFPFYVTVQKLDTLPEILIDCLRQWFESVTTVSSPSSSM